MSMSDTKMFYSILNGLLDYLETSFSKIGDAQDVKKIKKYRLGLELLNKTVVIQNFHENLKDHSEEIYNRNEEYFLSQNLLDFGATSEVASDSLRMKDLWNHSGFGSEGKETVWESLETLLTLSSNVASMCS